jgi:tripartite-type tricarboxylate transporter receptor subunit TctC
MRRVRGLRDDRPASTTAAACPVTRRVVLIVLVAVGLGLVVRSDAFGQTYPTRPIRMVVPFLAGGATDVMARHVAQHMTGTLGQTVLVENVTGAGGSVGARLVARAEPDGYTLLFGTTSTFAINPAVYKDLGYDPLTSFAPVARAFNSHMVLVVHPSVPVASVRELIAYAKANPGKLNYGSAGVGTPMHVAAELFKSMTGTDLVHVPYRGGAQSVQEVVAGQVQVLFENPLALIPLVREGKLRALAVTGEARHSEAPDVPTMTESGTGFVVNLIFGVAAPAGTPTGIVTTLNSAINSALRSADLIAKVSQFGAEPKPDTPENFRAYIAAELERWAAVAKSAGIKGE